ncbi:MAG: tetratricopeptide repeat protein, partial [Deltaproteobacteria bacterium]
MVFQACCASSKEFRFPSGTRHTIHLITIVVPRFFRFPCLFEVVHHTPKKGWLTTLPAFHDGDCALFEMRGFPERRDRGIMGTAVPPSTHRGRSVAGMRTRRIPCKGEIPPRRGRGGGTLAMVTARSLSSALLIASMLLAGCIRTKSVAKPPPVVEVEDSAEAEGAGAGEATAPEAPVAPKSAEEIRQERLRQARGALFAGNRLRATGKPEDCKAAIPKFLEAAAAFAEAEEKDGRAEALSFAGACAIQAGDPRAALPYLDEAATLWEETGRPQREAGVWETIGDAYRSLGQEEKARESYEWALGMRLEHGGTPIEIATLQAELSALDRHAGRIDIALSRLESALGLLEAIDLDL